MRKVLRESLYLLLAGQLESITRGEVPKKEISLGYEDFAALQPITADSSWRGAMAKAKQRKWVLSRSENGFTRFQLTRYGRDQIALDFGAFQRGQERSGTWTLLILQPSEGKRQQYAALKRELEERGAAMVIPSLYAWPTEVYAQDIVNRLEELGFFPCFLPVDPRRSRPTQLEAFWRSGSVLQQKVRQLSKISKESDSLLNILRNKKSIHHNQKAKIGGLLLSGMNVLSQFQWFEVDLHLLETQIQPLAATLDDLAWEYLRFSRES